MAHTGTNGFAAPKALGAFLFVLSVFSLSAQPCRADTVQDAKALFDEGMGLVAQQRYQDALDAFEESYRLNPNPTALINIAMCLKELHRYVESIAAFERFLDGAEDETKPKMRKAAEDALAEMKGAVAKISISNAPDGAEVFVDDMTASTTPLLRPILVNPGRHVVRITKERFKTLRTEIAPGRGERVTIAAAMEPETPPEPNATVDAKPLPKPKAPPGTGQDSEVPKRAAKKREEVSGLFIGGVVATMLGVGAAGTGAFFSYKGVQNWKEADAARKRYSETGSEDDKRIYTDIKDVKLPLDRVGILTGFITAGLSVVTGIVLFSLDSMDPKSGKPDDRADGHPVKGRNRSFAVVPAPGGVIVSY